ncbi:MAG: hypothetical protein ACXAD7_02495 [Candidatus Kariarchaeaceae archaeon]
MSANVIERKTGIYIKTNRGSVFVPNDDIGRIFSQLVELIVNSKNIDEMDYDLLHKYITTKEIEV